MHIAAAVETRKPNTLAKAKTDATTVAEVARKSLDTAKGDVQKAVQIMADRLRRNDRLFRELMDPLLDSACFREIGQVCRARRQKIWMAPNYTEDGNGERVAALSAGNLMMFPLPGGKPIGDATREEVEEAAGFYQSQASDMQTKAAWLVLVARETPAKKLVRAALTEEKLQELREKANGR